MPEPSGAKSSATSLAARLKPRLRPAPDARIAERRGELVASPAAAKAVADAAVAGFIAAVMDCSPFLAGIIADDPDLLADLLRSNPEESFRQIRERTADAWRAGSEADLMAVLRCDRRRTALLTALADLGGVWDVMTVTAALSDFADAAVGSATRYLLHTAAVRGDLTLADPERPDVGSGWVVLGMGKLGAGELNYSSDIDLIVLYDLEAIRLAPGREPSIVYVNLTKRLVHLLQERTVDGYVFRTDLRLRPDPGATNVAISTEGALLYYEGLGQNWERAALIKARPVAGDVEAGQEFLKELTPYIWRKYLDYAAIADIHSIKRQIHDFRGHGSIAVAGHNIKLGRGGIREIEFFVQTQQLIAGGRNPDLRGRATLQVLDALAAGKWIDSAARDDLRRAYMLLRTVEHCLQMVGDEQTHTLPEDPEALATIARMAGFADVEAFSDTLRQTLTTVRDRYAELFEAARPLSAATGSLVFTGDTDDPATLAALAGLGYQRPEEVTRTVRGWHFGRYAAMRSATARESLTEFAPALIEALARTDNPDGTFAAFDRFLARLPAGVQLFALLQTNPSLLDLLALVLSTAPRLAETIVQRAHVLDGLLDPAFYGALPDRAVLTGRLTTSLGQAASFEEVLDRARMFGKEQAFLIGVRTLAGTVSARNTGRAYSDLADTLLTVIVDEVQREFEKAHGRLAGGQLALVALGRLGAREMTASSDLDLMLLYDYDETASASDGARPLSGPQYYARLTQRIVAAISAQTAEGSLYAVDFRLRPSGSAGPIATPIQGFVAYHERDAWTWEHMALTRARPVAGDATLMQRAAEEIRRIVMKARARDKVVADVLEMRGMVEEHKGGEGAWDLKQAPGGLVDIEFVAQALQLMHGAARPEIVSIDTEEVLAAAANAGLLPAAESDVLIPSHRLYQSLFQILRLCTDGPFHPEEAPPGLLERLAQAGELPDFARLDATIHDTERAVRTTFERVLGPVPKGKGGGASGG